MEPRSGTKVRLRFKMPGRIFQKKCDFNLIKVGSLTNLLARRDFMVEGAEGVVAEEGVIVARGEIRSYLKGFPSSSPSVDGQQVNRSFHGSDTIKVLFEFVKFKLEPESEKEQFEVRTKAEEFGRISSLRQGKLGTGRFYRYFRFDLLDFV